MGDVTRLVPTEHVQNICSLSSHFVLSEVEFWIAYLTASIEFKYAIQFFRRWIEIEKSLKKILRIFRDTNELISDFPFVL